MNKSKVVILQKRIKEYRVPLFDGIGELYDTTVVGYLDPLCKGKNYSIIKLKHRYWPIAFDYVFDKELRKALQKADVVIRSTDFRSINNKILHFVAPKAKIVMFGIGVSASYNDHYDEIDQTKEYLEMIKNCDAVIFYYDYPKDKYVKKGADADKLFVANNTVFVPEFGMNRNPKNIVFIGELYRQKGIDILIEQYNNAYQENKSIPDLLIVGDGAERVSLENSVKEMGLTSKIRFLGKITDDLKLKEIFETAIFTISPKQAGLSVLKSMAFGVPFITVKNAITGGEIFNIENNETGIILNNENEIKNLVLNCLDNIEQFNEMGNKARDYYFSNRTMNHMINAFDETIKYVLSK